MQNKILNIIKKHELIKDGDRVLVAFSGGADSTALLLLLSALQTELGFKLEAAHYNHGIREKTADEDEVFCRALCERLDIPFHAKKEDVLSYAAKSGLSTETAARIMRYNFLYEKSKKLGVACIATAHHAEDNAESVLMHIIRGSGLAGICGMKYASELQMPSIDGAEKNKKLNIIRPLLDFKKSDITAFLDEKGQLWRTDETNLIADSARNILRLNIIPQIVNTINKNAVNNILRLGEIAAEDENYLSSIAKTALDEARANGGYIAQKLISLPLPVKKRAIRLALNENEALVDAEQAHIEGICALLEKQSGAGIDIPSARARMVFGKLIIEKYKKSESETYSSFKNSNSSNAEKMTETALFQLNIEEGIQKTPLGEFRMSFLLPQAMEKKSEKEYNEHVYPNLNTAFMDMDSLNNKLFVRTRMPGDRFRPVNSAFRMKLKDFFISRKVDEKLRNRIPLVLCGDEIVFIPGFLVSDAVKLTDKTKRILRIDFLKNENIDV